MFNFSSFAGFGGLNSKVAYEAMNNADQRMLDHRGSVKPASILSSDQEWEAYQQYKRDQQRLETESHLYADVWIYMCDQEARSEVKPAQEDAERQCAYCGSTRGFDGWNCIACGAC